jgi:hypothetical protein
MWSNLGHMMQGECTQEAWGKVENPKHQSVWCPHCKGANTKTLKRQRSIWEGDQELVKRSVQLGCNTFLHGSNGRYLSEWLSLSQLAKMLCLSYYCLYFLSNKIRDKGRTDSAWKQGWGGGGRKGPNNVCTCE